MILVRATSLFRMARAGARRGRATLLCFGISGPAAHAAGYTKPYKFPRKPKVQAEP